MLSDLSQFIALISDVEKVKGLDNNLELDMLNHLNEIIFLAKLCIWNLGDYTLELSPFSDGYGQYPIDLPEKYRYSIGE